MNGDNFRELGVLKDLYKELRYGAIETTIELQELRLKVVGEILGEISKKLKTG